MAGMSSVMALLNMLAVEMPMFMLIQSVVKDHIIVIPYDSENIEDNKMCIIWSISDYSAKDGLLSLGGYVGKTSNPEDYFYSFFEI